MRLILLLVFLPSLVFGQQRAITGKLINVDSDNDEPAICVNVLMKYRAESGDLLLRQLTHSDLHGDFVLSVHWERPPSDFTLDFSYPGYAQLSKTFEGNPRIDTLALGVIGLKSDPSFSPYGEHSVTRPVDTKSQFMHQVFREELLNHPQR
jgi:hypothetical protein